MVGAAPSPRPSCSGGSSAVVLPGGGPGRALPLPLSLALYLSLEPVERPHRQSSLQPAVAPGTSVPRPLDDAEPSLPPPTGLTVAGACCRSPLWISALCLALAASHVRCDDNGEYGLKVEYDPTLFNGTDVSTEYGLKVEYDPTLFNGTDVSTEYGPKVEYGPTLFNGTDVSTEYGLKVEYGPTLFNGTDVSTEYGPKVEYGPTLFNGTGVLMEDRNIASDWILRELLPPELDAEDLELELQLQEENIADACPPGPKGLLCRRRFALRGADECAGGRCVMCRRCDLLTPVSWPICCKNHFLCCRPIARACQSCNVTELVSFCQDKFGRC
ncbi:hypothetical protein FJT64_023360 [Amphibalanus amphitrite]|uniref:Uncharacterized protein n=1 Tax=Amphibalanus amphitrite TaxID=1232801 RepID=A0A6A4WAQ8_AMPAM|nr:hypothetical protein FJT64_023360 [Amphibalanus amphitrite]